MFNFFKSKQQPQAPNPQEQKSYGWAQGLIPPYTLYRGTDGAIYAYENMQYEQIVNYFGSIAPLYTAITRIANVAASIPIALVNSETNVPDTKHPALKLVKSPNPYQQKIYQELVRDAIIHKILYGTIYFMLTGNPSRPPLELYLLNPRYFVTSHETPTYNFTPSQLVYDPVAARSVNFSRNARFQSDQLAKATLFTQRKATDPTYISQDNTQSVYYVPSFHAKFGEQSYFGMTEITSVQYEINHWLHASQHNNSLLQNGARPSGAFVLKAKDGQPAMLSDEQFNRLKAEIDKNIAGSQNAGRPLVLEGGLEWQSMEMSPRDLDFGTLKKESEASIYKALGVPVPLIMANEASSNTIEQARLEFYESRVIPIVEELCAHFNRFLLPRYPQAVNQQLEFVVDKEGIDVLLEQRTKRRDLIEKSLTLTINEKRKIFKKEPILYGNKITDPNGRPIAGEDAPPEIQVVADNPTPRTLPSTENPT